MKVLWVDFSEGFEDLSVYPDRYGGCQIVPSNCRELVPDFYCLAYQESYTNVKLWEKRGNCLTIDPYQLSRLKDGYKLEDILKANKYKTDFDLVVHCSTRVRINTDIRQVVWVPGQHEMIHPLNIHLLLHSPDFQNPILNHNLHKIHRVQIGKHVPPFQQYDKSENLIFQCSNHAPCFQSIELARMCKALKIPLHLGGPISEGYPLMNEVDNNYVFYHGIMKYDDKIELTKRARIHTLLHNFPINFTLSGLEALAYGCGLITTPAGFWPTFITPSIGRMITTPPEFARAYEQMKTVDQFECWKKAEEYSAERMVKSFCNAFEACYNNY